MPAQRHEARQRQTRAATWGKRRGQQAPRNLTIPATQSSPKGAPVHGCKIEQGGRGALCDSTAQGNSRAHEHSFFTWRRTKSRAPELRGHKKRRPQGTRHEVGRVNRKVQMHVFKRENANLQGQGGRTGGAEKRKIHTPTRTTEQHPLPGPARKD